MRKDTLITIIMGVISIFTSCNPHPNLSKADQLINFYPDSSLTYLKAIQHPENTTYENHQITAVDMNRENLDGETLSRFPLVQGEQIRWEN